ncbi:uncharacterized protein [Choristoneura fumiferana]|uniref:uncharacterized protein n=1 Tax=Choristoneura fumiferana TaxID=7141 RepID=UPI003D15822A
MNAAGDALPLQQSICVTCLSQDRKLFPVHDSKSRASFLLDLSEGDALCWECHFFVGKIAAFRSRAARAQALLASALRHANETKINSLSSLMITPVYLEIILESSQVNVKTETVKEECVKTFHECPVEHTYDYDSNDVPIDESFELDDETLLPIPNKETEENGDQGACSDAMDYVTSTRSKLLSGKDLLDKGQEHPCKLEPTRDADVAPEYSQILAADELTQSQTLGQQFKLKSYCIGLEHIPQGDELISSYSSPLAFDCDLKRQATPRGSSAHSFGEQSHMYVPKKAYICNTCGKHFKSEPELKRHILIHSVKKSVSCNKCDRQFNNKLTWLNHLYKNHTSGEAFICDLCHKRYKRKTYLIRHLLVHSEKAFCCDVCGKQFTLKSQLTNHLHAHTDERPFSCDKCGKRYKQAAVLRVHLAMHTGKKSFNCDQCNKTFVTKRRLYLHFKSHSSERPFLCYICKKRFKAKLYLVKHLNVHTGEKSFNCDMCQKMFATKGTVARHKQLVHTHTDVRPFCCDVCQARFKLKEQLVVHMRVHTGERPYGCDVCGKRFKKGSVLKAHSRIHTGEKPFGCEICGKRFNQKSPMKTHLRTHAGKKAKKGRT